MALIKIAVVFGASVAVLVFFGPFWAIGAAVVFGYLSAGK
jgi:hypothetical protein